MATNQHRKALTKRRKAVARRTRRKAAARRVKTDLPAYPALGGFARTRKAPRKKSRRLDRDEGTIAAIGVGLLAAVGVDILRPLCHWLRFASDSSQHIDPRMNLSLADIKAQYPWLAEIGKVFR